VQLRGSGSLSCTRAVRSDRFGDSAGLVGDGDQRCDGVGCVGIWSAGRVNGAAWRYGFAPAYGYALAWLCLPLTAVLHCIVSASVQLYS